MSRPVFGVSPNGLPSGSLGRGREAGPGGSAGPFLPRQRLRPLPSARACLTPVHVPAHARSGPHLSVVPSPSEWLLPARGVITLVPS